MSVSEFTFQVLPLALECQNYILIPLSFSCLSTLIGHSNILGSKSRYKFLRVADYLECISSGRDKMDWKWCLLFNFLTNVITASMFVRNTWKVDTDCNMHLYFDCAQKFIFKLVEIETV